MNSYFGIISEPHFASHILGRISNTGQGQFHNFDIKRQSVSSVVCFALVAVDSNLVAEVVVDSSLVAGVVVDSNLVGVAAAVEWVAVGSNLPEVVGLVVLLEQVVLREQVEKVVYELEQQVEEAIVFFQQLGMR